MKTYCNPLDLPYRYQHMNEQGRRYAFREGADPTLVYFKIGRASCRERV